MIEAGVEAVERLARSLGCAPMLTAEARARWDALFPAVEPGPDGRDPRDPRLWRYTSKR